MPHLGGNIAEGDPFSFSPNVWNYVITRFAIKSVLDLGSGLGYSSNYFFEKGLKVIAVDGLPENIHHALYPTIRVDLTESAISCQTDLVHCQEVVEHIQPEHEDNLLTSLACGRIILMTNALPGQTGHHHVNERETDYWVNRLAEYNCHLLKEDTKRIRAIAEAEGAEYLAKTGSLFANNNRL
jgi:predicted O-methyltransferase YrrM